MALTYRSEKGSALTITELDDNFRALTGSQTITGTLNVTDGARITGSVTISGSNTLQNFGFLHQRGNSLFQTGSFTVSSSLIQFSTFPPSPSSSIHFTGSAAFKNDVTVGDDLIVKDESTLEHEVRIGYDSLQTNYNFAYQLNVSASSNSDKSARFDGGIEVTGSSILKGLPISEPSVSGQLWLSGSFSNSKYLMVRN